MEKPIFDESKENDPEYLKVYWAEKAAFYKDKPGFEKIYKHYSKSNTRKAEPGS